jgi:hypothetical protein
VNIHSLNKEKEKKKKRKETKEKEKTKGKKKDVLILGRCGTQTHRQQPVASSGPHQILPTTAANRSSRPAVSSRSPFPPANAGVSGRDRPYRVYNRDPDSSHIAVCV